jgi:hypothetical protein
MPHAGKPVEAKLVGMAFLSKKSVRGDEHWQGDTAAGSRLNSFSPERVVRWVAIPGVGAALGLWLVATMASLSSVGASLSSGNLQQTLLMPGSIALADPMKQHFVKSPTPFLLANAHGGTQALRDHALQCGANCFKPASASAHAEKSERLAAARPALADKTPALADKTKERFERMQAVLSPARLAVAFAGARTPGVAATKPIISSVAPHMVAEASLLPSSAVMASLSADASAPLAERFAQAEAASQLTQTGPQPMRFGQAVSETPSPSQLALALVQSLPVEDEAFASPLPITESSAIVKVSPADTVLEHPGDVAVLPEALSDDVPLPTRRPQLDNAPPPKVVPPFRAAQQQKPVQETKPVRQTRPVQPARQGKPADGGGMLAYARPDSPAGGIGQAFRNLFSTPRPGNGVAVYDISARTVYMPDGQRLEAHSGLGGMVDQPRYVGHKDRGPTPPDTYALSLREARFHGVEALRLTPVDGKNKYGRDGLLAHTYMLRGGRAESNGCVVFRDYARFLAAFKKGKITRLVVVPRLSGPITRVASNARRA